MKTTTKNTAKKAAAVKLVGSTAGLGDTPAKKAARAKKAAAYLDAVEACLDHAAPAPVETPAAPVAAAPVAKKVKFSRTNQPVSCRMCGKKTTWSEVQGNVGLDLCRTCNEEALLENEHLDGHHNPERARAQPATGKC